MLMRTDPFRELDRLTQQMFGSVARTAVMPMGAYREDEWFYVHFDLHGVNPDSIDLTVEQNVLTVKAERAPARGERVECAARSASGAPASATRSAPEHPAGSSPAASEDPWAIAHGSSDACGGRRITYAR